MTDKRKVRKAVFPVAGLGTRFLPATKAVPKEMLTVVDKPVIQYVVDEALNAGIEHLIFVTGRSKARDRGLFRYPGRTGTDAARAQQDGGADASRKHSAGCRQRPASPASSRRSASGHAVWCARELVGDETLALLLPDMIMQAEKGCLKGMVELYEQSGGNVIAVEECAPDQTHKYGIVGAGEKVGDGFKITKMVEKPPQGTAPSNFFINGRYILQPEIFSILATQERGAGNEIQLTDGMLKLAQTQDFAGYHFRGNTYDCGMKEGFILANVAFALARGDIRPGVEGPLKALLQGLK